MADNAVSAASASGGSPVASDDIGGVQYQRTKLSLGADGSATDALGGAGAVAAGVQRVTLASDDPAVAAIGTTNTKLDTLHTDLATTLAGYVDGLETLNGSVTETAPASDTASSGLNGRLQRIAQRLTSLIALLPTTIGGKTAAASLGVTLASDDPAVTTLGAKTDAKSTATDATSASGISIWKQISASVQLMVFGAGTAAAAQRVTHASDDPAVATLGATSGAAVITDANGTVQQYLRGLIKQWIAGTLVIGAGANIIGKVGIDQTTPGTTNGVQVNAALPAGTSLLGKIKTKFIEAVAATMTRPADTNAYAANDAVANNVTAGSVTALSFSVSDVNDDTITLERLRLVTSDTGAQGKNFRVWLYQVAVTPGAGDNAAFTAPRGSFIGTMSGTLRTFSDGAAGILVPDEGARIIAKPVSGAKTVIALIQTLDAFTPLSASTWIATLEGFQGAA